MGTVAMDLMGPVGALMKEELGKSVPPQAAATAGCGPSLMADGFMRGCRQTLGSGGSTWLLASAPLWWRSSRVHTESWV